MYDQLRSEYESVKRSAIQPANNFFNRAEPDLFATPANMMDNRDTLRKGNPLLFLVFDYNLETNLVLSSVIHFGCIWLHFFSY